MNFILLSSTGEGLGLAYALQEAGNRVYTYTLVSAAKGNFKGMLPSGAQWENHLRKDTVVLFDSVGGGKTADRLYQEGYKVIGGGMFSDRLEFDWEVTKELLNERGIALCEQPVPPLWNVEGWFYGKRWAKNVVYSLKKTRLMNDDLGIRTPGTGMLAWAVSEVHNYLLQLTDLLTYNHYVGPVSLTLDAHGRVVDWVCRFTFDSLPCWLELWKQGTTTNLREWFTSEWDQLPLSRDYVAAVRVSQPGYGSFKNTEEGKEVLLPKEGVYLFDVQCPNKVVRTSGFRGAIATVVGTGSSMNAAFGQMYERAWQVQCEDRQFRTDLQDRFGSEKFLLFNHSGEVKS